MDTQKRQETPGKERCISSFLDLAFSHQSKAYFAFPTGLGSVINIHRFVYAASRDLLIMSTKRRLMRKGLGRDAEGTALLENMENHSSSMPGR